MEIELLPSERKELLNTIAVLKQEKEAAHAAALRKVNRIVLTMESLSVEQKTAIIEAIWEK